MFKICKRQLLQLFVEPRIYIVILLCAVPFLYEMTNLVQYSEALGEPLGILDGMNYCYNDYFLMAVSSLGVFLLLADIPFTQQSETYVLLRISRKKWIAGKLLYMLCVCFLYYFVLSLIVTAYIVPNAYAGNLWSDPIYRMATDGRDMATDFELNIFPIVLLYHSPMSVFLLAWLLSSLYGFVLAIILFFFNIRFGKAIGYLVAMSVHAFGYIAQNSGISFLMPFSLFRNSLISMRINAIFSSVMTFLLLSIIFVVLITWAIRQYDFKISVGTKQ